MKSKMKMMVRAYDKELKIFTDLKNNKRTRRQLARVMAIEWADGDYGIDCQDDADVFALDHIYYLINRGASI